MLYVTSSQFLHFLTCIKVIDYKATYPLHSFLAKEYGQQPFDIILDTVGSQDLYTMSPAYLKPKGLYVNVGTVGVSQLVALWRWFTNSTWPSILGGVPRKFIMFNTVPDKPRAKKIYQLAENKQLKIIVDSIYKMDDALEVSQTLAMSPLGFHEYLYSRHRVIVECKLGAEMEERLSR